MPKKRVINKSAVLPFDFPSPNLTAGELRLMEEKQSTTQSFSLLNGYTRNKSGNRSGRSVLSISNLNGSIRSMRSQRQKSSNSLFSKRSNSDGSLNELDKKDSGRSSISTKDYQEPHMSTSAKTLLSHKSTKSLRNMFGTGEIPEPEQSARSIISNGPKQSTHQITPIKEEEIKSMREETMYLVDIETSGHSEENKLVEAKAINGENSELGESNITKSSSKQLYQFDSIGCDVNACLDEESQGSGIKSKSKKQVPLRTKLIVICTAVTLMILVSLVIALTAGGINEITKTDNEELRLPFNSTGESNVTNYTSYTNTAIRKNETTSPTYYIHRKRTSHPTTTQISTTKQMNVNTPSLAPTPLSSAPVTSLPTPILEKTIQNFNSSISGITNITAAATRSPRGQTSWIESNISFNISTKSSPSIPKWTLETVMSTPFIEEQNRNDKYNVLLSHDGSSMIISAPFANNATGIVKLYKYELNAWNEIRSFLGKSTNDQYGISISFSSDGATIAVGAMGADSAGYVQIYREISSGIWKQIGNDVVSASIDSDSSSGFGYSISLSEEGNLLVVGAPYASRNGLSQCGCVEFFAYTPEVTDWVAYSHMLGEDMHDWFGYSLSLSNGYLVVGAPKASYVRVYRQLGNSEEWEFTGAEIIGQEPNDSFGEVVSITTTTTGNLKLCVGAPSNSKMGTKSGVILTYESIDGLKFDETGGFLYGKELGNEYGRVLSLSEDGKTIVIGGNVVHIYELELGIWKRRGLEIDVKLHNAAVSLSNDGAKLALVIKPGEAYLYKNEI